MIRRTHTVKKFFAALLCFINLQQSCGTTPVVPSKNRIEAISIHLIKETFLVFHIYLVVKKSQEKPWLPN